MIHVMETRSVFYTCSILGSGKPPLLLLKGGGYINTADLRPVERITSDVFIKIHKPPHISSKICVINTDALLCSGAADTWRVI